MPTPKLPTVSSSVATPMPIFTTLTTLSTIHSTLVHICYAITDSLRYALAQDPHSTMLAEQSALVQSSTNVESPISSQW